MNDDELRKGFISKSELLEYITEEDIFSLVFGFKPVEYQYVTSPFRKDTRPGCWFQRDVHTGKLRFTDFGNSDFIGNIKMTNIDCFDAVQVYFKLPNFYRTLEFIKEKLIDNKSVKNKIKVFKPIERKAVEVFIDTRDFDTRDKRFWESYGISKQNLIDDKVFPIKEFKMTNTKKGDIISKTNYLCYCYTNFRSNHKKIYRPFHSKRFTGNCVADDIGEIDSLPDYGRLLVISKSYKDCRVIRNYNYTSIWFQNEGMIPSERILLDLSKRFTNIVVFFDNDEPGMKACKKVVDVINNIFTNKAKGLNLPVNLLHHGIKDPADLFKKKGPKHLYNFLNNNI